MNPSTSWGEVWLLYMSPRVSKPPTITSGAKCFDYNNKGLCSKTQCQYLHLCTRCGGAHPKLTATSLSSSSHTMGKDKMPFVLTPQTSQAQQTKNFNFKTQQGHKSPVSPKDSVMGGRGKTWALGKPQLRYQC